MNHNLLLDTIEKYFSGEMNEQERNDFEALRRNNPEVDQLAAEHLSFVKDLSGVGKIRLLKKVMHRVEDKLIGSGVIQDNHGSKGKVVYLWKRYKRTIAVAGVAAVVVSVMTASGVSFWSAQKNTSALTPLVDNKLHQIENKINQMENKLNDVTTPQNTFEPNFRATGFLADGNGYIITNAHVINKARNIVVENNTGEQYKAITIYSNPVTDLAILKISDTNFHKLKSLPYTFKSGKADLSEHIFTLGYPREDIVYNEGYLSALSGYYGDTSTYQISIAANPGNSGGPVMDRNGNIIGVISSKEANADGVVFAIQSRNIVEAAREINEKHEDSIKLPARNTLKGKSRSQQIKSIEDYVFKIKGN